MRMISASSTFGSSSTASTAASYRSDLASPMTSTGFLMLAADGKAFLSLAVVSSENRGISRPRLIAASVAITPGPPALVTIARALPLGMGWWASMFAVLNSSSIVSQRMMPASSNTASQMASSPASEPVWLDAASAPWGVLPDLIARIGLACGPRVIFLASSMSPRPSRSSSR